MLKLAAPVIVLTLIGACNPAKTVTYGAGIDLSSETVVSIEGVDHVVFRKTALNTYLASTKSLKGGPVDATVFIRNVQAIETVTNCKLNPLSIVNKGLTTLAAVDC